MYLTRIYLNPQRRGTWRLARSRQVLHAAIMNCFPPGVLDQAGASRVLWRLDRPAAPVGRGREGSPSWSLYISSPVSPDPSHIVEEAGYATEGGVVVRELDGFLDRLEVGQRWGFRVCVNPTFRKASQRDRQGRKKILAHVTQDQQLQWLLDRAEQNGFAVLKSLDLGGDLPILEDDSGLRRDGETLMIQGIERSVEEFRRQDSRVTLSSATFDGVLEVTDSQALRSLLVNGIGRAKAYGCGLMTLSRP